MLFFFFSITLVETLVGAYQPLYPGSIVESDGSLYIPDCQQSLGNGYLAQKIHTSPSTFVHVAGIYNGKSVPDVQSHRADLPSTRPAAGYGHNILDFGRGFLQVNWTSSGVSYQKRVYAHRSLRHLLVTEIEWNNPTSQDASLVLEDTWKDSKDTKWTKYTTVSDGTRSALGRTLIPETESSGIHTIAMVWTDIPQQLKILAGSIQKVVFITAIATSLNSTNPMQDATNFYNEGLQLANAGTLLKAHTDAWEQLWHDARVELQGNLEVTTINFASYYIILSSMRSDWPWATSPADLGSGFEDYWGHVFWDYETWVFPALLMVHPEIVLMGFEYRLNRLEAAHNKAKSYKYEGAMFPWESAFTGIEVDYGQWGQYEHHVTGDVGFAVLQYFRATHDMDWLERIGYPLIEAIANFWGSRVKFNATKSQYIIQQVMGPDEIHYPVDNSGYTNAVADICLQFAIEAAKLLGKSPPSIWRKVAGNIYIPFDSVNQYHPEYDGYTRDTIVKQADTILMNFPLMYNMSSEVVRNDLDHYVDHTEADGPCMTYQMFSVGYLEIGELDQANSAFQKGYQNNHLPLRTWTETHDSGAENFLTGAGGFLQSVLFGYGGLRLRRNTLDISPNIPPDTTKLILTGIKYRGSSLTITADKSLMTVTLTTAGSTSLFLKIGSQTHPLKSNQPVSVARGPATIQVSS